MDEKEKSALSVQPGVKSPPTLSHNAIARFKARQAQALSTEQYVAGILSGNRSILSKAITLIESTLPQHRQQAVEIIQQCVPHSGRSIRIGITGVPGVGRGTFIESLGCTITAEGKKLAVLAIDPSSERSKGSILGDKTRMETLATDPNAFIRPSPSAGTLGGVAHKTRESMLLCEAAGYDVIFVETVGVGQSETTVRGMVDFFLLLMLAGAGDELQGIKRGIMEMADSIAITKADSNNENRARIAQLEYQNALHLFPANPSGWLPRVQTCSSLTKIGLVEVWNTIQDYQKLTKENGSWHKKRQEQSLDWFNHSIQDGLMQHFYENQQIRQQIASLETDVVQGKTSPFNAAQTLLKKYFAKEI